MSNPTQAALRKSQDALPPSIADLPAQRSASPATKAQERALYFNTGNPFNLKLAEVPALSFTDEPARALHPDTPTGLIACDRSRELGTAFAATTPLVLARYARIRAGESLRTDFEASGVIVYVMVGSGSTGCAGEELAWQAGDVFVLPGGCPHLHRTGTDHAVLWIVTNEPQLAFENLRSPAAGAAPTEVVHFPAQEIERQIDLLYEVGRGNDIAGAALIFSSTRQEAIRNVLPTLTVAMNSLPPGASQRAHRHNSVAVSLVIEGDGCHSMVDGRRKDWSPWATTVTLPTAVHSHHNRGDKRAKFLIVQDGRHLLLHARAGLRFRRCLRRHAAPFARYPTADRRPETMSVETPTSSRLTVRPLGAALGAEVRGIDMQPARYRDAARTPRRMDEVPGAGLSRPARHRCGPADAA